MKYSICNIQLLPKAVDLRKKAFDEFPLNMAIVLQLLSRNALITALGPVVRRSKSIFSDNFLCYF